MTARAAHSALAAALLAGLLTGCAADPVPAATTTPSVAENASPSPAARDFTRPGEATAVIEELLEAAGTINAIKLEISRDAASLSVVEGMTAKTYAWRAGRVEQVDSDTQYVGQAIFDPRAFAVDPVARLFARAAELSGSTSAQELQVVDYNDGLVLMTVTTTPESQTVFFRQDGSPVDRLDLTTAAGLEECVSDAIGTRTSVLALGVLPGQGCYVDTPGANDTIDRTLRGERLPARTSARNQQPTAQPFETRLVDVGLLVALAVRYAGGTPLDAVTLLVERPADASAPRVRVTAGGTTTLTTLTGDVLPG